MLNAEQKLLSTASLDRAISANIGHEIEHTDKNNRSMNDVECEVDAEKVEENILKGN